MLFFEGCPNQTPQFGGSEKFSPSNFGHDLDPPKINLDPTRLSIWLDLDRQGQFMYILAEGMQ
jgi:hypothetical protein